MKIEFINLNDYNDEEFMDDVSVIVAQDRKLDAIRKKKNKLTNQIFNYENELKSYKRARIFCLMVPIICLLGLLFDYANFSNTNSFVSYISGLWDKIFYSSGYLTKFIGISFLGIVGTVTVVGSLLTHGFCKLYKKCIKDDKREINALEEKEKETIDKIAKLETVHDISMEEIRNLDMVDIDTNNRIKVKVRKRDRM